MTEAEAVERVVKRLNEGGRLILHSSYEVRIGETASCFMAYGQVIHQPVCVVRASTREEFLAERLTEDERFDPHHGPYYAEVSLD